MMKTHVNARYEEELNKADHDPEVLSVVFAAFFDSVWPTRESCDDESLTSDVSEETAVSPSDCSVVPWKETQIT
jgi:hypothetical protein